MSVCILFAFSSVSMSLKKANETKFQTMSFCIQVSEGKVWCTGKVSARKVLVIVIEINHFLFCEAGKTKKKDSSMIFTTLGEC